MKHVYNFLSFLCLGLILMSPLFGTAGESTKITDNPKKVPNQALQEALRGQAAWQSYVNKHNTWRVHFNEENARPHRAFGNGISTIGVSVQDRAMNFITSELGDFNIPVADLVLMGESNSPKHNYVNYYQRYNGLKVLDSRMMVKMTKDHRVIMFGADVFDDISISINASLSRAQAEASALNATEGSNLTAAARQGLFVLPVAKYQKNEYKLVYEVIVDGKDLNGVPSSFYTLVDASNGDILRQFNMSHTHAPLANVEATVTGDIYPRNAYAPLVNKPLQNMRIRINNTDYFTDTAGFLTTNITAATTGQVFLDGPWAKITTGGSVPSFTASLVDGPNAVSFNSDAIDTERNAFYHVNIIHDWVTTVLANFTGMDYQVKVNMDQPGTCNASFGGGQMNFFLQGGGCLSLATIGDVVYHEYGHGTNTAFYSDNGGFWQNGAMHEGYADVWGFSLTLDPLLGKGMSDTDPETLIRRYDIDPKIFPDDLVGQVHADGEIIAGSWWDLYLNLDSNMTQTMDLFEEAYFGLQAQAADGNEGSAFRDVLLDVLQADDIDGNIGNGTPNMLDICDAFAQHGITLISNATLAHTDLTAAATGQPINIDASLTVASTTYLGDVMLFHRLKGATSWTNVAMANIGGTNYQGTIPGQAPGAIVEYYIGVTDNTCGSISAVKPIGADAAEPTLPYFILVDYQQEAIEDFDNNNLPGSWTFGVQSDQATTGLWSLEVPAGMLDNGYELAPATQFTPGGFTCAVTGLNTSGQNGNIGQDDVDNGETTLLSPIMDLTGYFNPVFTYRRWFANASPSSANAGNDPWFVQISGDGGTTWTDVEFTYVGDNNWRRFAFNVQDFILPTATVQLKFQVSDSILTDLGPPGCGTAPFCGGSLVEAALDEFKIWSQASQPIAFTTTNVSCNGECDGSVLAVPDGGVAPFQYLWNDPAAQTTATATGLCGGVYQVRTIDAIGDTITATAFIVEPAVLAATTSGTNATCSGCNDGTVTVVATGGTTPYAYLWNDGQSQTTMIATGLDGGSYTSTVTDASGCTMVTASVGIIVGIEEVVLQGSVVVYPNPARDYVHLNFTLLNQENVTVSIVNYLGKEVYFDQLGTVSAGQNTMMLPMEELSSGVYTVKLLVGDQVYPHKVNLIK